MGYNLKMENLRILERVQPHLVQQVNNAGGPGNIEVVISKNGKPVPALISGSRKVFIHSRFDPEKEAERFIGEINCDKHDLFMVFGFGFGYHVDELLKNISPESIIMVIEKDENIFAEAVTARDMKTLFKDERLIILIDPDEEEVSSKLKGKSSKSVSFITHRGSHQAYPEYYANMLGITRSYLSTKDVNIATLAKFEKIWCSNIARNIINFSSSPGINIFYERFRGIPAVVAGAGPSLPESYGFLRENRDRMIIIAVDTSYRMLINNGIEPHFCLSVDPQVINARYFEGCRDSSTVLIYEPSVHPSVLRFFRGRKAAAGIPFDIMKWIEVTTGEKGEITHGGSVSTNAYDFARRLGASPVYLVGQDLGFTGGLAHARGSYMEEQVHMGTTRTRNQEMHNRFQLYALPRINARGIRSDTVHTNQKMMIFLSWFEKSGDKDLVNLTCDGAYINGIEHQVADTLSLAELEEPPAEMIGHVYSESLTRLPDSASTGETMGKRVKGMLEGIDELIPHLEKGVNYSGNLVEIMRGGGRDSNKINYILKKLAEVDSLVESGTNVKDMISLTIQRVIHTINEGYELESGEEGLSEDELVAGRSHYLYRGLLEGALFNKKILGKMQKKLQDL